MREFAKESGSLLAQFTLYSPFPGTVDFLEMMQDRKVREQEASSKAASAPKHLTKILYDKFWLSSTKPAVLIEHPNMDEQTLIREIKKSWASFYNWKEIRRRAQKTSWPLVGKIWYALACFGFKALYAGYGFSADSVKTRRMKFLPSVALKAAVLFHNTFFRKPVQHAPVIPNRIPDRIISPPELEERVESHAQI